jgi:hypothetical protein
MAANQVPNVLICMPNGVVCILLVPVLHWQPAHLISKRQLALHVVKLERQQPQRKRGALLGVRLDRRHHLSPCQCVMGTVGLSSFLPHRRRQTDRRTDGRVCFLCPFAAERLPTKLLQCLSAERLTTKSLVRTPLSNTIKDRGKGAVVKHHIQNVESSTCSGSPNFLVFLFVIQRHARTPRPWDFLEVMQKGNEYRSEV